MVGMLPRLISSCELAYFIWYDDSEEEMIVIALQESARGERSCGPEELKLMMQQFLIKIGITRSDFQLQPMRPDLPVQHWTSQPPAFLQSTWKTPFLNLLSRRHAKRRFTFS